MQALFDNGDYSGSTTATGELQSWLFGYFAESVTRAAEHITNMAPLCCLHEINVRDIYFSHLLFDFEMVHSFLQNWVALAAVTAQFVNRRVNVVAKENKQST